MGDEGLLGSSSSLGSPWEDCDNPDRTPCTETQMGLLGNVSVPVKLGLVLGRLLGHLVFTAVAQQEPQGI